MGLATAAAWVAVVGIAIFGRSAERFITRGFLLAAGFLLVIVVLSALSLGWTPDPGSGFTDVVRLAGYLAVFLLAGMLLGPGSGRSALTGIAVGLIAVGLIAIGSRLLGIGAGDSQLVEAFPSSSGRLSYPIGYWNALGAMVAMAVPLLVWLAAEIRGRRGSALVLAGFVPVLLATYMTSSRGALIAAALGAGIVIAVTPSRGRALAALLIGSTAAVPSVITASVASGILDSPGSGPGGPEFAVCGALALGIAFAALVGPGGVERLGAVSFRRIRMRHAVAASIALLAVLLVLVGPGEIAGDFAATSSTGRESVGSGSNGFSVSGSGRAQFWGTALDAFGSDPVKGIGTGAYAVYWNQHGGLETPVQNAHSEPLELLAEVGLFGLLAFAAFFGVVVVSGVRRARGSSDGAPAGACLGLLATGLIGLLIDWTWDLPAVMVPILVAAAILSTRALDPPSTDVSGSPARSFAGRPIRIPAPAFAAIVIALAIPAIWAGGVLAAATDRLEASDDALARGQLNEAAQAARSAAEIEPWAADPWLQLATVEQAAGNLDAARTNTARAIELAPEDFRSWLLAANLEAALGNNDAVTAYAGRALFLAPLVLPRASIEPGVGLGSEP